MSAPATPVSSPPPPTGTNRDSRSGAAARISTARLAWPRWTSGSVQGWTKANGSRSYRRSRRKRNNSGTGTGRGIPPAARNASTLAAGAVSGSSERAVTPSRAAAQASASAVFPALTVESPARARSRPRAKAA